jgi:Ca-activated chloride channel family protein
MKLILLLCLLGVLPGRAATVGDPVASRSAEARAHYEEGQYDEALRAYRDALVDRPESAALHLNVGDALYQLGEYEQALEEFERTAVTPDVEVAARGFYNKGNTHIQLQDYGAAVESYRQALERNPRDADTKANLELALRLLQTPPPQQGGEDSESDSEESQDSEGGERSQQRGEESEAPQPPEPESGQDEEPPEPDASPVPADGEEENADEDGQTQADEDDSQSMDEDEAEQLLDALRDRDAQSQQRRYRAKRRGDDVEDW